MTSAAFTILYMGIQLEYHSLTYCTFGAFFGFVFGWIFLFFESHNYCTPFENDVARISIFVMNKMCLVF